MSLRQQAALHDARRVMRAAFENLERIVSPTDAWEFKSTTLQHVKKAALEIENRLGERQSLCNMRRILPLFSGLEHFAKSIEVLCNGTPYMPWIWAPAKLILKVKYPQVHDCVGRQVDLTQSRSHPMMSASFKSSSNTTPASAGLWPGSNCSRVLSVPIRSSTISWPSSFQTSCVTMGKRIDLSGDKVSLEPMKSLNPWPRCIDPIS